MVSKQGRLTNKKYLIINADDLGMSPGINRGIIHAFKKGVVASSSLLVKAQYVSDAVQKIQQYPQFDVGLHIDLKPARPRIKKGHQFWERELEAQITKCRSLLGANPSHIDFHGGFRVSAEIAFAAKIVAARHGLHNRDSHINPVVSQFYGKKQGRPALAAISLSAFATIIREIKFGLTEMICHPGITSHRLKDPYRVARNIELKTLTNPAIPSLIKKEKITLINYKEAKQLRLLGEM